VLVAEFALPLPASYEEDAWTWVRWPDRLVRELETFGSTGARTEPPGASRLGAVEVLAESTWRARAGAHEVRVDAWIEPHLSRRRRGEKHPVHDFLFTYYSQRPAALRRWHPGWGVALLDAP